VKGVIRKALGLYGPEGIAWVHPDCGMRALEREVVRSKLKNMVKAVKGMEVELR